MSFHYNPVQIAYFVNDVREAALRMSATTGAGPFYVIDDIELEWASHRGRACNFLHSSAYGQWGNVMLELVQQNGEGSSPFSDLYQTGEEGIHHVACFVDSLDDAEAHFEHAGIEIATRAKAALGTEFWFVDTTEALGHMIEIYERSEPLLAFYDLVKDASEGWNRKEVFLSL